MTESSVLLWVCEKCGNRNYPNGNTPTLLPAQVPWAKCENCGNVKRDLEWSDSETKRMMDRQGKGLPLVAESTIGNTTTLGKEIEVLKESRNADRKELELVRKMLDDLIQNELKKIRDGATERDQDLATLTARVKALEDWKKLTDDMK